MRFLLRTLSNLISREFARPTRLSIRAAKRWSWSVATVVLLCSGNADASEVNTTEHHTFLVDTSGSMLKAKGKPRSPLHDRQQVLRSWLNANPTSVVTMMSFDVTVSPARTFDLAKTDELGHALAWVDNLGKTKAKRTFLWSSLPKAIAVVSNWGKQHPSDVLMLHVFTDRRDTEGRGNFADVIRRYPNVQPKELPQTPNGDFDLVITHEAARPDGPPAGVNLPPPLPNSGGDSGGYATAESSSTASPTPSPPSSVSFEIQEPRVVLSGEFVHFINRTSPPADSYTWTIRHNASACPKPSEKSDKSVGGQAEGAKSVSAGEELKFFTEHLVHQFCNEKDAEPQSYTVILGALRDDEEISSAPMSILVQTSPAKLEKNKKEFDWEVFWKTAGAIAGFGTTLVTGYLGVRNAMKTDDDKKEGKPEFRRIASSGIFFLVCLVALAFGAYFTFGAIGASDKASKAAAEQNTLAVRPGRMLNPTAIPIPGQSATGALPVTVINNIPTNPSVAQPPITISPSQTTPAISVVLLTIVVLVALVALAVLVRRRAGGWPSIFLPRGSPIEQLQEVERLYRDGLITGDQLSIFKKDILDKLQKQYGISAETSSPKSKSW